MRRSDAVSGFLLLLLGVYGAWKAHGFGLGTLSQPGAGFFPFIAGVLIAGCAAAIAVRAFMPEDAAARAANAIRESTNWWKVGGCVAALLAYAVALPLIGFALSTFLVMFALSRLDRDTTWLGSFLIAGVGSVLFWVMFVRLLTVRFPPPKIGF
jgi:putative tricarboxylic transport membrane protein